MDFVPTAAGCDRLEPAILDDILASARSAIDAMGGRFTMHGATLVVTARLTPPG